MWNRSINIWGGSAVELAWFKKSSSYFESNFPIFLLFGISNTSIFKVRDVLHWKSSPIFPVAPSVGAAILYTSNFLSFPINFIYIMSFFITILLNAASVNIADD